MFGIGFAGCCSSSTHKQLGTLVIVRTARPIARLESLSYRCKWNNFIIYDYCRRKVLFHVLFSALLVSEFFRAHVWFAMPRCADVLYTHLFNLLGAFNSNLCKLIVCLLQRGKYSSSKETGTIDSFALMAKRKLLWLNQRRQQQVHFTRGEKNMRGDDKTKTKRDRKSWLAAAYNRSNRQANECTQPTDEPVSFLSLRNKSTIS